MIIKYINKFCFVSIFIGFVSILTACINQPAVYRQSSQMKDYHGIVILGTHTDWVNKESKLKLVFSKSGLIYTSHAIFFDKKHDLKIYTLSEGEYEIERIVATGFDNQLNFTNPIKFSIKRGKAVYLGDITLNVEIVHGPTITKFSIVDRYRQQINNLKLNNKELFETYNIEKNIIKFPEIRNF